MLAVVGIDVAGHQAFDGTGDWPVEPVEEHGFEDGSFKQDVGFPCRRSCSASGCGGRGFAPPFCWVPVPRDSRWRWERERMARSAGRRQKPVASL